MLTEQIARVCHEVNRAYCVSMGDESQLPWDQAPKWQQESAIKGVTAHLENPELSPRESHELWVTNKMKEGWVYGPQKNVAEKQHPCMVAYYDLPMSQRSKDYIFKAIVNELQGFRKRCTEDEVNSAMNQLKGEDDGQSRDTEDSPEVREEGSQPESGGGEEAPQPVERDIRENGGDIS